MRLRNSIYYYPYKDLEKQRISFADISKKKNYYNQLGFLFEEACRRNIHTEEEASFIINVAQTYVKNPTFLDLACGVGRHARILSNRGFIVYGVDASRELLNYARKKDKKTNYIQADMRDFSLPEKCDCIYSIWDSYVYLSQPDDIERFMENCYRQLNTGGILILQSRNFQNKQIKNETDESEFNTDNYRVQLTRSRSTNLKEKVHEGIFIYHLKSMNNKSNYLIVDQELVRTYTLTDMRKAFKKKFSICGLYGDYDTSSGYSKHISRRLIIVAQRK